MRSRKDSAAELPSPHAIRPRLWQPESETTRIVPFISVLVPVRNEGRYIAATLIKLLHQRYVSSRYEVIVADGESDDDTCAQFPTLQARHANLQLVSNPGISSSAGRTAALPAAHGE